MKLVFVAIFEIVFTSSYAQKADGIHQPYPYYWLINELLEWNPELKPIC